ncbi:ankryin repeat protein [Colletotrichum incanum]|nr:ankryin repeat protein [Colletotrichum incanum]
MSDPGNYTVGWICAITTEYVAAQAFLDERHERPARLAPSDSNNYALGKLSGHNVVIAVLPHGEYGTTSAAVVARDMLHSFPNIRLGLMVGIGGGAPSQKHDIRLGDIVVSCPRNGKGGVFQYDFGKTIQAQAFQQTGFLNQPPLVLRTAVAGLEAMYEVDGHQIDDHIKAVIQKKPKLQKKYSRPHPSSDRLYKSDIVHPRDTEEGCSQVCDNDALALKLRRERDEDEDDPKIHYGLIASANQLMKDALIRDKLAEENDVLCFEMEAAGLMNHFPCLVIRGICDYSDSHKNKDWQGFAAMAAAAYAKDLLNQIPVNKIEAEIRIEDVLRSMEENLDHIQSTSNKIVNTVEVIRSDNRVTKIKNWLSPPDTSTNFNHARGVQHEGTCTWFIESTAFKEWRLGSRRHLWFYSIPGGGKTVLCAKVLDHLKGIADCVTLEFFFDFSDTRKQKVDDVLRSLAFQLYKLGGEDARELDGLFEYHQGGLRQPETAALANTLYAMMKHPRKICIIIDALDECTVRSELLTWMNSILSNPDFDHIQLLAASRPEEEFQRSIPILIGEENCIRFNKKSVTADIRSYIKDRVENRPEFKKWSSFPSVLRRIEEEVGDKADGMFRWAACQLDSLEACLDREGIEAALKALPRDLNETYNRILQHIPQERKRKAIRLLQFLVHSERPLLLQEAVDVVAVRLDNGQRYFDVEDRVPCPADITRFCPSLVSITRASDNEKVTEELQLAHFSVKEYLLHADIEGFGRVEASVSITHTCLTYLTSMELDQIRTVEKRFPLARYAARIWMDHAKLAGCVEEVVTATVSFLRNTTTFRLWARLHQPDRPWHDDPGLPRASCLYFACLKGLIETTKHLLLQGADVNTQGGYYGNALQAASSKGHKEIIQMLLDKGADVNAQGGNYGNALQAASFSGHKEIVQMLLDKGADVNTQGSGYGNALQAASFSGHKEIGHKEIIQMLLDKGADVNAQGGFYAASSRGHKEIVQMLLDKGADVNTQGGDYGNALQAASSGGHKEIGGYYGNALQAASYWGHKEIVQMLLDKGADVNAQGSNYGNALQAASLEGHKEIVQMLLDKGADVNAQGGYYGNALQAASSGGHKEIVQMFLDKGGDVNTQGGDYGNALQAASSGGHKEIVQILLDKGADVNAQGGYYERINVNARDEYGRSALLSAVNNGHTEVV